VWNSEDQGRFGKVKKSQAALKRVEERRGCVILFKGFDKNMGDER